MPDVASLRRVQLTLEGVPAAPYSLLVTQENGRELRVAGNHSGIFVLSLVPGPSCARIELAGASAELVFLVEDAPEQELRWSLR